MEQKQLGRLRPGCMIYIVKKTYSESESIKEPLTFRYRLFSIKIVKVRPKSIMVKPYVVLNYKEKWLNTELEIFGINKWEAWNIALKDEETHLKALRISIGRIKLTIESIKAEKKKYKKEEKL